MNPQQLNTQGKTTDLVYIKLDGPINAQTVNNLIGATFDQINKGAKHIYYLISSFGGSIDSGITAYNLIKNLPVKTTMHNINTVQSIAIVLFLASDTRIASPEANFYFHGSSFDTPGPSHLEIKDLEFQLNLLDKLDEKTGEIYRNRTDLKIEDLASYRKITKTFTSDEALEKKIITSIEPLKIEESAYLISINI